MTWVACKKQKDGNSEHPVEKMLQVSPTVLLEVEYMINELTFLRKEIRKHNFKLISYLCKLYLHLLEKRLPK